MKKIFLLILVFSQMSWSTTQLESGAKANFQNHSTAQVALQARPRVSIKSKIDLTEKADINFYDIVSVDRATPEILKKLSEIKIQRTSTQLAMSREEMLKLIRQVNLEQINLQWVIPDMVQIQFHEQIDKSEIERKVMNHLQTICSECEFELQIDRLPIHKSKSWHFSVQDVSLKSSYLLPAVADGKNFWISVRQKVFKAVPVTTRWIPALQRIQQGDLEIKKIDISSSKDGFLSLEQMTGTTLLRSLPIGSVVGASDIKREAAVKRGQVLKAQIESSDFEISVSAIAEESGYIGDVIKIKTNEKQMSAKIKDNGSVVVL